MTERLFKVLGKEGISCHGGEGKWSLPHDGKPGEWVPPIEGKLVPCKNGYHLCRESDLVDWLNVMIFEAEYQGERIDCDDKVVVREARLARRVEAWNERTARLFACDCAERVLHIFERAYPDDNRPREAIEVARRFANGVATQEELNAAWGAAWGVAWGAERDTAWAAIWVTACAAAWAAARDAASAATSAATSAAASAATSAVASAVAWAAARDTALDTGCVIVWGAARDAAWVTAWGAEREWQLTQLMKYLYPVEGQDVKVECEGTFEVDEEDN